MGGGIGEDCQSLRTERDGPKSSPANPPGTLLYTPGVGGEGRDAHTYIYTCTRSTHPFIHKHSFTDTQNPAGLKWAQDLDIDLFFLSLPHPPIFSSLAPHP